MFINNKKNTVPKCWATSRISFGDLPSTSKAFKIAGKASSKWTSTTAPITDTTCPLCTETALTGAAAAGAGAALVVAKRSIFILKLNYKVR